MAPTFDERIDDAIARGHADAVAAWEIRQKGLMDEVQEMEIAWGKLYEEHNEEREGPGKGKAMVLLALRIKQRWQEFITEREQIATDELPNHMVVVDWKIYASYAVCARDCLEAEAYRDTLKYTKMAFGVSVANGGAWMEDFVIKVLCYEKEAWIGLGEHSKYLDIATRRARSMANHPSVPRDEVVSALCEVATVQIDLDDYQAAEKTAREAVSVEGFVPPASRNIARMKLGV